MIRNVCIADQYITLISALNGFGFPEKPAAASGQRLVLLPYDWRRSNADSAITLSNAIQAITTATPDASIMLLAHSMGGLVARYYLESGRFSLDPGFANIAALIIMATPNKGAVAALETILGLRDTPFLSRSQAQTLCSDSRYPAGYQLLPAPLPARQSVTWSSL